MSYPLFPPSLSAAIAFNWTSIFDFILQSGHFNVNNDEGEYGRPIQVAAEVGGLDFVQELLERGAEVNAEGGVLGTALQAAKREGCALNPDTTMRDAKRENQDEVVQLFLRHGVK